MPGPSFLTNPMLSLICFCGKGGVGKTTSASATALYLAYKNPQKRILLASIDPAHSLMDSLKNTNDFDNLKVWEIDAQASFQKFIERHNNALRKILDRGSFLDETDISKLLTISLPGIDELMGMIELVDLIESNAYDVVILDTAPTGHTLKFLQIPHLLKKWIQVLNLMMEKHRYLSKLYVRCYQSDDADTFIDEFTKGAKKIEHVLQDKSCEFVPVMLPEALSINETRRFLSILKKYKIPVNNIIINRAYPMNDCDFCNGQYLLQKKHIDEIKPWLNEYNFLIIPLYKDEVQGKEPLLKYAQAMVETLCRDRSAASCKGSNPSPSIRPLSSLPLCKMERQEEGLKNMLKKEVFTEEYQSEGDHSLQNADHNGVLCSTHNNKFVVSGSERSFAPAKGNKAHLEDDFYNSSLFAKGKFSGDKNHFPIPKSTLEFLMFSGKGGVGKTTLASATALFLSDIYPQKRILLFSTDPAHSLSDCLNMAVGDEGLSLKKNLSIEEMDAEKEYHKLKHLYSEEIKNLLTAFVKRDAAINVVFEKEIMESLIDITPPGIDEVMAITKIIDYMDKGSFDIFVLDTAPTGHLIRFLEMPELALDWLKFFFNLFLKYKNNFRMPKITAFLVDLSKKIKKLLTLLRDGEKSLFIPIAIPTEMAYEETKDLIEAVKRLRIPIARGILNMVHPVQQKNTAAIDCSLCLNRVAYEEKMFTVFKQLFPIESFCILHKQKNEVVGIKSLQLLGKELYGVK